LPTEKIQAVDALFENLRNDADFQSATTIEQAQMAIAANVSITNGIDHTMFSVIPNPDLKTQ